MESRVHTAHVCVYFSKREVELTWFLPWGLRRSETQPIALPIQFGENTALGGSERSPGFVATGKSRPPSASASVSHL